MEWAEVILSKTILKLHLLYSPLIATKDSQIHVDKYHELSLQKYLCVVCVHLCFSVFWNVDIH